MAEVTAGPKVIKEEDDMDTAAEGGPDDDEATQLLAEVSDAGSASGVRGGGLEDRTCPICKKVSKSATTLRMHLRNVHINAGSSYVCELCGVSYKLKASLEKHMKGVHQENRERDAICDVCGFATFSNQELKMHRQRVHDKTWKPYEKVYTCPYCDYSYHEKRVIDNHVKAIHEKRRDLQCPLCEFRAPHTIVLNKHIRKHLVLSKTYKCMEQGCAYATVNMANLDNHLRKAHKQGKECTYCDFESSKYNNIREHMKAIHPKAEYFNCTKCGYKSQLKYLLDRHFHYVHSETNVFKCHMCDYSGNNVAALTKHVKEEHDRMNPFKCSKCSFRCPEEHILAAHTAKSHVKQEAKAAPEKLPDLSKWLNSKDQRTKEFRRTNGGTKTANNRVKERRKRRSLKERGGGGGGGDGDQLPEHLEEKLAAVKAECRAPSPPPPNCRFDPPDPSELVKTEMNQDNDDDNFRDQDPDYAPGPEENSIDWRDLVHPSAEFSALSRRPSRKNLAEAPPLEDALAREIAAAIRGVRSQQRIAPSLGGRNGYTRTRSRLLAVVKQRCFELLEGACLLCDFVSVGGGDAELDSHIEAVHVGSPSPTENSGAGQAERSMKEQENNAVKVTENNLDEELENGALIDHDDSNFNAD